MEFLKETIKKIEKINKERMDKKEKELNSLLKTPKGLGRFEEIAIQLEGIEKNYFPKKKAVVVMAADNGVEREGISKSKRVITQYVVEGMLNGKSSINALGKIYNSDVIVVDLGIDERSDVKKEINLSGIINKKLMEYGTDNIAEGSAMSYEIAVKGIETGIRIVDELIKKGYNLFAAGEMGIGNTTTSSAMLKAFTDLPLDDIVGYGSGINEKTLIHKKKVIEKSLEINRINTKKDSEKKETNPIEILSKVGGLDIAGMTGLFLGCAKNKVPIVIDGFICAISAFTAFKLCKEAKDYMIPSHLSEEPGMKYIMKELNLKPCLQLDMKLGEGTGAVVMFPVIDGAVNITKTVRKYPNV